MFLSLENHTRHHIRSAAFINAKIKIERQKILLKPNKKMQHRKTFKKKDFYTMQCWLCLFSGTQHRIIYPNLDIHFDIMGSGGCSRKVNKSQLVILYPLDAILGATVGVINE